MRISNETKIGILAVVGILLLYMGYSFLKGKSLFKKETKIYAVYEDIQGLNKSNPVVINGLQVGTIANLEPTKDVRRIVVTVHMTRDVVIPKNSLAVINPNLLGSTSLEIKLGNSTAYLQNGDTLITTLSGGAFDEAMKMLNPVLYEVRNAVKSLDSVLHIVTNVFDPSTKNNIKSILRNLDATTASFSETANSLKLISDPKSGALAQSLRNVNEFTANLNTNNGKINSMMSNADKAMGKFASLDLNSTLAKLDNAATDLKAGMAKINSKEGSLGLLLNDKKLYDNLSATSNKINILLDDIRVHPKRYLTISVFGKKSTGDYLTGPLVDDTVKVKAPKPR
jgi:phospholipid/cholesterol/gamma-HCH transport system substrate-binding protein